MRIALLQYLWCPACHGDLGLFDELMSGKQIVSGRLVCSQCAQGYPIIDGVPDFVERSDGKIAVEQTTEGFAGNWKQYNRVILQNELLNRDLFADWIWPLAPTYLEDKIVIDAGCGMGRWLRIAAEQSPKVLIGFDYSSIVWTAHKNTAHLQNVHVLRADIFRPPIRPVVDVQYSIGVVHHTPDPAGAFASLQGLLTENGVGAAWVYGQENNEWITNFVDPLRKHMTSRLPPAALNALSGLAALQLRLAGEAYAAVGAPSFLPYREYLIHLREYPLNYMTHIVYDHLIPTLASYLSRDEVLSWAAGNEYVLSPRNANSWRLMVGRSADAMRAAIAPLKPADLGADVLTSLTQR